MTMYTNHMNDIIERLDVTTEEAMKLLDYFELTYNTCDCDVCQQTAIDAFIGAIQYYSWRSNFSKKE